MKKVLVVIILILTAFILTFTQTGCEKSPSSAELKASIELLDVETKWVKKYYQPWPPRLILVPAISFRAKNLTEKTIRYLNFNAIFRFSDESENLGDSFMPAVRGKPIHAGEVSDVILMKCNFGVEGRNLSHFKDNPHWKKVIVKLFAKSKGSQYALLGEWEVSRNIDFKEPEPIGPEKKEEKLPSK